MLLALSHFSLDCLTASQVITLLETCEVMLLELVAVICLKVKRIKQEIRRVWYDDIDISLWSDVNEKSSLCFCTRVIDNPNH